MVQDACVHDFEISGGIWNFNNRGQAENPLWARWHGGNSPKGYSGFGMMFVNVKNFKLTNMTLKDPVNFAVTLDTASWFTVEDITFDYNYGHPTAVNMDGIHVNGNCHYGGTIRDLKGACYDDRVALNADEGTNGPTTGYYDAITLDNICASKAEMLDVYCKQGMFVFPFIYIQEETVVKNLKIHTLHRRERFIPIETVFVGAEAVVDTLILENVTAEDHTEEPMPFFVNNGTVEHLVLRDVRVGNQPFLTGTDVIGRINE